jgi:prepilin-type N-terminal cleavage/methylation domain-containing protein
VTQLKNKRSLGSERGFTLPEVLIVIVIMGILFGIATSTWFGVVEGRQVDSATNQMISDLRLAHTSATNRLTNYEIRLNAGSSTYQIGPSAPLRTRTLSDGTTVDATLAIVFKPDGSVSTSPPSGSPITFKVRSSDGDPAHNIQINTATSRVKVVD